nr:unnamed protein product [Spirometra erinaceieuropaei]
MTGIHSDTHGPPSHLTDIGSNIVLSYQEGSLAGSYPTNDVRPRRAGSPASSSSRSSSSLCRRGRRLVSSCSDTNSLDNKGSALCGAVFGPLNGPETEVLLSGSSETVVLRTPRGEADFRTLSFFGSISISAETSGDPQDQPYYQQANDNAAVCSVASSPFEVTQRPRSVESFVSFSPHQCNYNAAEASALTSVAEQMIAQSSSVLENQSTPRPVRPTPPTTSQVTPTTRRSSQRTPKHSGHESLPCETPSRTTPTRASEKLDAIIDYVCEHITFNSKDGQETGTTQASGIFLQSGLGILDSYSKSVQEHFGASSIEVDYVNKPDDSRHVINQWIESRTNGKIKELLPDGAISSLTTFVIASAVYFKGIWKEKFAPAATTSGKFYPLNGQDMSILMMQSRRKLSFAEFNEELGGRAVRLPFERQEMIIVLPNSNDGLPALLQKLLEPSQGRLFSDIISRDVYHQVEVRLRLPKFKLTKGCSQDLKKTLSALGMPSAFDASKADFSAITGHRDLFLSAMFHKAVIEVDESGAEAAAATAAVANTRCMPINMPQDFIVDHPFLLFIISETGLPIFMGHVVEPESNS